MKEERRKKKKGVWGVNPLLKLPRPREISRALTTICCRILHHGNRVIYYAIALCEEDLIAVVETGEAFRVNKGVVELISNYY